VKPATPPPDFDLPVALASIEGFRRIEPDRLLFSHFGPVTNVDETLDASVEELELWVEMSRDVRRQGLDLDHAVAAVRDRTRDRYAALSADPELREKHEVLNSDEANLSGILRWLEKVEP
jgi:hypothetical protein